jgi:hypothetical protein
MVSCCIVAITPPYNSHTRKIQIKHVFQQQSLLQAYVLTGTVYRKFETLNSKGRHPKILAKTGRRFSCVIVELLAWRRGCGLVRHCFLRGSLISKLCFQIGNPSLSSLQFFMLPIHLSCCTFKVCVHCSSHPSHDVNAVITSSRHYGLLRATHATRDVT